MRERFSCDVHHRSAVSTSKTVHVSMSVRSTASTRVSGCSTFTPDECVDCGACEPVCPVEAIYYEDDVPEEWSEYTQANVDFFKDIGSPAARPRWARSATTSTWSQICHRSSTTSKGVQLPDFPGTGWPVRRNWHRGYREEWLICRWDAGRPHSEIVRTALADAADALATPRSTEPMRCGSPSPTGCPEGWGWTRRRQMYCRR